MTCSNGTVILVRSTAWSPMRKEPSFRLLFHINYTMHLYRPHAGILDGAWSFPVAQPLN